LAFEARAAREVGRAAGRLVRLRRWRRRVDEAGARAQLVV